MQLNVPARMLLNGELVDAERGERLYADYCSSCDGEAPAQQQWRSDFRPPATAAGRP